MHHISRMKDKDHAIVFMTLNPLDTERIYLSLIKARERKKGHPN
jgi:hypothetical protein